MSAFHQGGCACGAVRYRTEGPPARAVICHCRYCQLRTGSAFGLAVYFEAAKVTLLSGVLKDYAFTTDSGRALVQRFCPECGTSVLLHPELLDGLTGVAGGTFDPPSFWYDILGEGFTRSRAPFVGLTGISVSFETSPSHRPVTLDRPALNGG